MSLKLSRLKKWLTLEDSAKYLSLLISEEVTTTDLLQLALQGDLTLSINLVNSYHAQTGPKVPIKEAQLYKISISWMREDGDPLNLGKEEEIEEKEKNVFLDQLIENTAKNYFRASGTTEEDGEVIQRVVKAAAQSPSADSVIFFKGDALPDYSGVLEFNRESVQQITGLWDLSMVGSESLEIEDLFYGDIDGPGIDWVKLCGVILKHPATNRWANLVERFNDETKEVTPQDFYPRESLPEREPLVIRRDELQRFANTLNESETTKPADQLEALPNGFRALYDALGAGELPDLDLLILAWRTFWKDRRPNDGKKYPINADVADWIKNRMDNPEQGNSKAKAIASIIRPTWAPTGRQPNRDR